MTVEVDEAQSQANVNGVPAPSVRAVVAALAGMAAAWLAAGSTGLLTPPLRHGLSWIGLAVAVIASWPPRQTWKERLILVAALAVAVGMTVPATGVCNVLAACLVLAMLARANRGLDRRILLITALAAAVLGVWLLACTSIPTVWSMADALGRALGRLAGLVSGRPLWVGSTFAGLDFLVLMTAILAGWLVWTSPPRLARALYASVVILGGHLAYLVLLSYATDLHEALPPAPPPPEFRDYIPPPWSWSNAARTLLPWSMPVLAGVIQLAIAAAMFRWARWQRDAEHGVKPAGAVASAGRLERATAWGAVVLAVGVPWLATLMPGRSTLAAKKIVAYNRGYLDWEKPVHERYGEASAGMYGMLPEFVASLGGRLERSDELTRVDLEDADVLVLIHPAHPWPRDRLERIWDYVRRGGSLLVVAGTMVQEGDLASSFNEVLEPTAMHVRFDTAASVTWNWQDSYTPMAHPAVTGIDDGRNRFGMESGPSIDVRWPARPILVGRWGWSDPGRDAVLTGMYRYDAPERLGDLVLAAEQRLGRGRVVVLSDAASLTNQGNVNGYVFTGRLLAYLAGGAVNPQAAWRQALGLLGCLALLGLMAWPLKPTRVATVAVVLALALGGSRAFSHLSMRVLPDGRQHTPYNNVAYIDASHMEAYSDHGWGYEGIAGLALTLMRNGYQPFLLPKLTKERLERAGMLISIAPARPFSNGEQAAVHRFVERGGIFICTVGAGRAGPVQPLLEQFGLHVPGSPVRPGENDIEPKPMSFFPIRYRTDRNTESYGLVYFYTGWPIECPESAVLLRGTDDLPVASWHQVGKGKVVLIGDTAFAMNKNLEYVGGEPFFGRHDNAHFWRWLITHLTDQEDWIPPPADRAEEGRTAADESRMTNEE